MGPGHGHPKIRAAIAKQSLKLAHGALLVQYPEPAIAFSERLVKLLPEGLDTVFLANSGAESVEAALKLARFRTRRRFFVGFTGCFHGRTYGALSLTISKPVYREGFGPFLDAVHAPYPYVYRHPARDEEACVDDCIAKLETVIRKVGPKDVAAIVAEPIEGEGGYIVPPRRFFKEVRSICDRHGILLVDDEVQAGCMRTGKFLAIEHFKVKPDIVCLAKALGGGLPLGAMVASRRLMRWPPGSHASTFGGNLLSCAAGMAALGILGDKRLGAKVTSDGEHALARLRKAQRGLPILGDVRGLGLMIGLEIVTDKASRREDKAARDRILKRAFEQGVLALPAGHSAIRLAPPLIIGRQDLDAGLDIIIDAIMDEGRRR
jgi:4-aminobutyrate aminotransferase